MSSKTQPTAPEKLRAWMTLNDESVPAFAKALNVTPNTVYRWLKGEVPRPATVRAIHERTGIAPGVWYR